MDRDNAGVRELRSWTIATLRLCADWAPGAGKAVVNDARVAPAILNLAMRVSQKSEPWYSFADQNVRPSDGSTVVLLKSRLLSCALRARKF